MKHRTLDALALDADLRIANPPMSFLERRARWAAVLDREPKAPLNPLAQVEFVPKPARPYLRAHRSPLAIAYADPMLRAEGLGSDALGDGGAFFGLGDSAMHGLVCGCRYGGLMLAGRVARRVRRLSHPNPLMRLAATLTF